MSEQPPQPPTNPTYGQQLTPSPGQPGWGQPGVAVPNYGQPAFAGQPGMGGPMSTAPYEFRDPIKTWLLGIVTFGIYFLIWFHRVNKELSAHGHQASSKKLYIGLGLIILVITIPVSIVLIIMNYYETGKAIAEAQQAAGRPVTCNPALGILFSLVLSLLPWYYQKEINAISGR